MRKLLWGVVIGQLLITIIGVAKPFEVYSPHGLIEERLQRLAAGVRPSEGPDYGRSGAGERR
jgi:hypothetical protein